MKKKRIHLWVCAFISFVILSCTAEDIAHSPKTDPSGIQVQASAAKFSFLISEKITDFGEASLLQKLQFVEETCLRTDFGLVLQGYFENLLKDPDFDLDLVIYYTSLINNYVTHYRGENYFGAHGEYTKLAEKRIRELKNFWELNREIIVNGQHTAYLDDREILTDMIESFDRNVRNRKEAYEKADMLLNKNAQSPYLPESPYFALDGFTKSNGLLVIGDGLIESLTAIGVDDKVVFTALIAHEWWHQAQYENEMNWNLRTEFDTQAEFSRFIELEADFAAAYFMTHKRGATYNWKRIEDFFKISFNVGDCLEVSNTHHGTPAQRLSAARLGFELADQARKKGFILTPEEVHLAFLSYYNSIIN